MMREEEMYALARRLLATPEGIELRQRMEDPETMYVYEDCRGGRALLIGADGSVLFADSSIAHAVHLKAFRDGIRTPLEKFEGI